MRHRFHAELHMCEVTDDASAAVPSPAKEAGRCKRGKSALAGKKLSCVGAIATARHP